MPDGRAIKLRIPEAYPKRPARAVTDLTVRFISELGFATCDSDTATRGHSLDLQRCAPVTRCTDLHRRRGKRAFGVRFADRVAERRSSVHGLSSKARYRSVSASTRVGRVPVYRPSPSASPKTFAPPGFRDPQKLRSSRNGAGEASASPPGQRLQIARNWERPSRNQAHRRLAHPARRARCPPDAQG